MTESEKKQYKIVNASKRVEKQLDAIPDHDYIKISHKIQFLSEKPRPFGSKKLSDKVYRIRIGNYRVVYSIFDKEKVVVIDKVGRRKERTYKDF